MRFTFEQLLAFVTTAREGSFSAAARKLGKAQSVISTAVSNLELDCGVDLFSRQGRYPVLTEAGQSLLAEANFILSRCQRFSGMAEQLSQSVESHLVLAIDELAIDVELDTALQQLSEQYPDVEVEVIHPVLEQTIELVRSGKADLGITLQLNVSYDGLDVCSLGSTQLICVAASDHPLARLKQVELDQLAAYRQVVIKPREAQTTLQMQLSPQIWSVENAWTAAELIKLGNWWGVVPLLVAQEALRTGNLIQVDTQVIPSSWHVPTDIFWRQAGLTGPVARWTRDAILAAHSTE